MAWSKRAYVRRVAEKQILQHKGIFTTDDSARCVLFTTTKPCESGEKKVRAVAESESLAFLF